MKSPFHETPSNASSLDKSGAKDDEFYIDQILELETQIEEIEKKLTKVKREKAKTNRENGVVKRKSFNMKVETRSHPRNVKTLEKVTQVIVC